MKVYNFKNSSDLYTAVAKVVVEDILKKPSLTLGLAAGKTPTILYKKIVEYYQHKLISMAQIKTFNLDEFVGVSKDNPSSFYFYMQESLLRHLDVKQKNIFYLDGASTDLQSTCQNYEEAIQKAGGIDLQILGLGTNGHIAFNEPGSDIHSCTRVVTLSEASRRANQDRFNGTVPTTALTMGLKTIYSAKKILLLALGESKRDAVKALVSGQQSNEWPCTILATHPNLHCYFDLDANPV